MQLPAETTRKEIRFIFVKQLKRNDFTPCEFSEFVHLTRCVFFFILRYSQHLAEIGYLGATVRNQILIQENIKSKLN
jgi:hypothetical protein